MLSVSRQDGRFFSFRSTVGDGSSNPDELKRLANVLPTTLGPLGRHGASALFGDQFWRGRIARWQLVRTLKVARLSILVFFCGQTLYSSFQGRGRPQFDVMFDASLMSLHQIRRISHLDLKQKSHFLSSDEN